MNVYCLQHAADEGPLAIADWVRGRGHQLHSVHLYAGEKFSDLGPGDALLLMGGAMNIYQHRDHPWLREEFRSVERAVARGNKVVGICFGAQMLADILGARVTQNPVREIGWFPVEFTAEARAVFPSLPASQTVLHWHGDTFTLPPRTLRLAASEACAEQGFLYERQILALQFHPEGGGCALDGLSAESRAELTPECYVQDEATLKKLSAIHAPPAHRLLHRLLDEFFAATA